MSRIERRLTKELLPQVNTIAREGTVVRVRDASTGTTAHVSSIAAAGLLESLAKAKETRPVNMTHAQALWADNIFAGTGATVGETYDGRYYLKPPQNGNTSIVNEVTLNGSSSDTRHSKRGVDEVLYLDPDRSAESEPTSQKRPGISLPEDRPSKTSSVDQKREERAIALAQTISFGRMAKTLLGDITDLQLGYSEHLSEFHELIPVPKKTGKGGNKPRLPAPLAIIIADREVRDLGLQGYLDLETGTKQEAIEQLRKDLRPGAKHALSVDQILQRVKVEGYHWNKLPPAHMLPTLRVQLEEKIKDIENNKNEMGELYEGYVIDAHQRYKARGFIRENGRLGLMKAMYSYDWRTGYDPGYFIWSTIDFELRREGRDQGHVVRPDRVNYVRFPEYLRIKKEIASEGLRVTEDEVAARMGITFDEATELMIYAKSREDTVSVSASITPNAGDSQVSDMTVLDFIETTPSHEDNVLDSLMLPQALAALSERDRRIIVMRFWGNMTQAQIGQQLGISQMHVSRLLADAFATMNKVFFPEGE